MKYKLILLAALFSIGTRAQIKPKLVSAYQGDMIWNGVTKTDDGRVFVCFPRIEGDAGIRIGELKKNGKVVAYPNISWNNWKTGDRTTDKIVRANSLRIGPDGNLWIVDTGAPKMGDQALPGGSKLVVINVVTNKVVRTIPLDGVMKPNSFIDDLRIYGSYIYLTDAGEPALVMLNKNTGKGRRVLENDSSTVDTAPLLAEGQVMRTQDGKDVHIHADQLEVSPDGKYLYFQPVSGPLSRIETKYLLDQHIGSEEMAAHVTEWAKTPTTGGTAMDAAGNIYVSDVDQSQLLKIDAKGKVTTVIKDRKLVWSDALWIDKEGYLWMPAGQLNRIAAFQNGISKVKFPVHIYKLKINAKPFRS